MAVLSRWQATITDEAGNVVPGAWIEVRDRLALGSPLASIYEDRAGATPLGNPCQADSEGYVRLHAVGGVYRIRAWLGPSGAPTFERVWDYVDIGVDLTATYAWTGLHEFTQPVTLRDISGEGSAARSWALGRHPTGAGAALTLAAGGAHAGGNNLDGGALVLSGGIATGNGGSVVQIKGAQTGLGSGATDRGAVDFVRYYADANYTYTAWAALAWSMAVHRTSGLIYYAVPSGAEHVFRVAGSDTFKVVGGNVNVLATTTSTTTTSGALTVAGGLGVAGNANIGGWCAVAGELATTSTSASISPSTGALRSGGGLGVAGAGNFGSYVNVPATSGYKLGGVTVLDVGSIHYTRILDPMGGQAFSVGDTAVGSLPYLFFDRAETWFRDPADLAHPLAKVKTAGLEVLTTTASTSTTSGSGTFAGGVGVAGDINVGGYAQVSGNLTSLSSVFGSAGIGYRSGVGTGGDVTQATNKGTGVTLNKATGRIRMNGAALAAGATVSFVLTNSLIAYGDTILVQHASVGTFGAYRILAYCGSGSATIYVTNQSGGSLSEAIDLIFTVIKGAIT